jgi:alkylhydroperoxidase family enzyme
VRERAALAFSEAVTLVATDHVPDEAYADVAEHYSEDEIAALISLLVTINAWNTIGPATRAWVPGA